MQYETESLPFVQVTSNFFLSYVPLRALVVVKAHRIQ